MIISSSLSRYIRSSVRCYPSHKKHSSHNAKHSLTRATACLRKCSEHYHYYDHTDIHSFKHDTHITAGLTSRLRTSCGSLMDLSLIELYKLITITSSMFYSNNCSSSESIHSILSSTFLGEPDRCCHRWINATYYSYRSASDDAGYRFT